MNKAHSPHFFYQFLGAHSLLIGLLPFFLPVFLWQQGLSLAGLCMMIGFSGLSFAGVLGIWQHIWVHWKPKHLITLTFGLELLLVAIVGLLTTTPGAALFPPMGEGIELPPLMMAAATIGVANGLYNAFFWTTQRSLFLQQLGSNDTGKQYGNFQIFVTVFLKLGILLGGWLLNSGGIVWILALSAGVGFAANTFFSSSQRHAHDQIPSRATLKNSLQHQDKHNSRTMFMIDGVFLYLESHFWTLTLFLLVREDFSRLGFAVVVLALSFAAIFYLIKNQIDLFPTNRIYQAAVGLYATSWLLRFTLTEDSSGANLLVSLVLITFCSSFFRLALNKRFFDIARNTGAIHYLLVKSYSSQIFLGVVYLTLGLMLFDSPLSDQQALQYSYLPAAFISLAYLRYRERA